MPALLVTAVAIPPPGSEDNARGESERFLLQAFRCFAEAADSLERSYGMLRAEVARLRSEQKESNAKSDGAISLLGLRTLAATVNNILHFHSLPAPERVPTDLGQLLDWAGGFLAPMARRGRVELCLRNRLQGVWFATDRHRLEQVLLNLVLNALRAMPGGGWVEISGYRIHHGDAAAAAAISVSDTGPGVGGADAARMFEPGFSTRAGSPGLGLAVCRRIVEQHGGSIAAANRAGSGASFTLTFPLG